MKKLHLLLLLVPGVLWAQSTQPTSAPVGPKGPPLPRYIEPASEPASLPAEPASVPASLPTEATSLQPAASLPTDEMPVVLIAPDFSGADVVKKVAPKEKALDESARLQGIWRSTRDPLEDYKLRGADEKKSFVRARRLALGLTLVGYGVLGLGGSSYYSREFGSGDSKIPELFTSPISLAIGAGLVIVGPSAGHIYAGEPFHAVRYSLRRTLGAALLGVGASGASLVLRGSSSDTESPLAGFVTIAGLLVTPIAIPGAFILVHGTSKEIRDAKYAAIRHNTALKLQQSKIIVQPGKDSVAIKAVIQW